MRIPIAVHSNPFDIKSAELDIDTARRAFADYLDQVPRKSTKSKHGLMGPVGKILSKIKSGSTDAYSLKGYAVSVHESTVAQVRGAAGRAALSPAAMANLERGISALVNLLDTIPIPFHDRVIEQLDYGLYWELRRRENASKEARRQAWISFLVKKYSTEGALAAAWDEPGISLDELYLPKAAEGARSKKATTKQRDIADFWESQGALPSAEGEED